MNNNTATVNRCKLPLCAEHTYTAPRDGIEYLAKGIHKNAGTWTKWFGYVVKSLTDPNFRLRGVDISGSLKNLETINPSAIFYTSIFTYLGVQGFRQSLTPWYEMNNWVSIENKFDKSLKATPKLLKISDILKPLTTVVGPPAVAAAAAAATAAGAPEQPPPDATFLTLQVEKKDKPNKNETHIQIPLTKESLVIKHKKMYQSFGAGALGTIKLTVGILGAMESSGNGKMLGKPLETIAKSIVVPVQGIAYVAGSILGWVTSNDNASYGIGNLVGSVGFGYASYRTFKSTDFTWFKVKTQGAESHIKTGTIALDLFKVTAGFTLGAISAFTANEFLSGGS